MHTNSPLYFLQTSSYDSYTDGTDRKWTSVVELTISQLAKSKRELIMERVSKSKRSVLNKLQSDEFPVPSQEKRSQFYRSIATPCSISN